MTNNGKAAARLTPMPKGSRLEELRTDGQTRAVKAPIDLAKLKKAAGASSQEILDDLRGQR